MARHLQIDRRPRQDAPKVDPQKVIPGWRSRISSIGSNQLRGESAEEQEYGPLRLSAVVVLGKLGDVSREPIQIGLVPGVVIGAHRLLPVAPPLARRTRWRGVQSSPLTSLVVRCARLVREGFSHSAGAPDESVSAIGSK